MHGHWFIIIIWFTYLFSTATGATPTLVPEEGEILKEIAKTLGKSDWNFSNDLCSGEQGWATPNPNNVTCNCTATVCHITGIIFKSQNLSGVLPSQLDKLPFIQTLDLSLNYLSGTIPVEWGYTKLVSIALQGNRLTGRIPKEITNISTLTDLVLDMNHISGPIPQELGSMPKLKRLLITSNKLSGSLPQELANLTGLQEFAISDNEFTGKIPDFIGSWANLVRIELQASGLEGPIPPTISQLSKINDIRISDLNGLGSSFPDLRNLKNLNNIILRSCNIIGGIPAYLGNFTDWKLLDLSFNMLTGQVPESFSQVSSEMFVYLSGNRLTGKLPEWLLLKGENVDLSYNNFITEASDCKPPNANIFGSSLLGNDSEIDTCTKSPCPQKYYTMNINCGGNELTTNGNTSYGLDSDYYSPSVFKKSIYNNWALSSTGNFLDNDMEPDSYTVKNISRLSMKDDVLYRTARISPISLTYYGYCMGNGSYTVILHFAEIQFTSNKTYSSLGRRIFDVYIQGIRVLKDFNIEDEAGGFGKEVKKKFTATVNETLEIRFFWAGKGTQGIPKRGVYGPLISAITVYSDFEPPSESAVAAGSSKGGISTGIVAGIVVSLVFFIFVMVAILWWKGCLRQKMIDQELINLDIQTGSFTLRQIKTATNNFDPRNKIGEGGFGPVFKGCLSDGRVIAVKQLSSKSKQGNQEFVNEIGMISAVQNPYLVKLYGCCIEGCQLLLVYEYLENNSLARALFDQDEFQIKLDWRRRQKICVGIARGLAYLHEESTLKIIHRDIKATNILLDKDLNPKISDFGLARLNEDDSTHISTRIAGTFGYMAPEYAMRGHLTDKADVYSFGIVALEIVTGKSNLTSKLKEECADLLEWAKVLQEKGDIMELLDPRLGSDYIKDEVMGMINIALACTNVNSTLRPAMSSVVSMLEGQNFVSDSNVSRDDSKLQDITSSFKERRDGNPSNWRTQLMPNDNPWRGSSSSAQDLYPLKLDSHYWSVDESREASDNSL